MRAQPINEVREKRKEILFIITTVIILTSAINILTTYLSGLLINKPILVLSIGIIVLFLGLYLLTSIFLKPTERTIRIYGAIAFEAKDEGIEPIEIACYEFNKKFCTYLNSFISENKAYAKILTKKSKPISIMNKFDPDLLDHFSIINSVIEYVLLDELQLHLNSYFVKNEIDNKKIVTLERSQLSPNILKNRVIDMITKDMSEREAFITDSEETSKGKVVYSTGSNGIIYNNIELQLPPKSKLYRNDKGFIVISNKLFDLTLMPVYEGFSKCVSPVFLKESNTCPMQVTIKLHVRTKNTFLFNNELIEMYEWLDSFIDRIENDISIDKFEQRLNVNLLEFIFKTKNYTVINQ